MEFLEKMVFRENPGEKNLACRNFFGVFNKFFLMIFLMTLRENRIQDKCLYIADARVRRTGVGNTENPRLRSKTPVLAVKMLKNRKK